MIRAARWRGESLGGARSEKNNGIRSKEKREKIIENIFDF